MTDFIQNVNPGYMQEVTTEHNAAEVAELMTMVQNLDPATLEHLGAYLGSYSDFDNSIRPVNARNTEDIVVVIVARFPQWTRDHGQRVTEIAEKVSAEKSERERIAEIAEIEAAIAAAATEQDERLARLNALRNK